MIACFLGPSVCDRTDLRRVGYCRWRAPAVRQPGAPAADAVEKRTAERDAGARKGAACGFPGRVAPEGGGDC